MIYGLYLSAQGADAAAFQQSVLANNLANASTTAFKRDIPVFRAHDPFDVAHLQPPAAPDTVDEQTGGLSVEGTVTDFSQGSLRSTGSDFDLAITSQRPTFLEVGNGRQKFLTRNGQMAVNPENLLVMADQGLPFLTETGEPIEVPAGTMKLDVAADGVVSAIDAANVRLALGQLSLVEPESPELMMKEGASLYANLGKASPATDATLKQGMVEDSETEPVSGMLDLIQSSRGFEMNMNLIRMQDEMLAQLLQTIPRK